MFDGDPGWCPGKENQNAKKRGSKPMLTQHKWLCIAASAMALKDEGKETNVPDSVARTPVASLNPRTGAQFTDKYILQVFRKLCYDKDPSNPWGHEPPLSKTTLPPKLIEDKLVWAKKLKRQGMTPAWCRRNCNWVDPCSTVIPKSARAVSSATQAINPKVKRWASEDAKTYNRNLRPSAQAGKQCAWGDVHVWWFFVLARGEVRLPVMGTSWVRNEEGMAEFVDCLPEVLRSIVGQGAKLSRVVRCEGGPGLYQTSSGHICKEYHQALKVDSFRPFAREEVSWQAPTYQISSSMKQSQDGSGSTKTKSFSALRIYGKQCREVPRGFEAL